VLRGVAEWIGARGTWTQRGFEIWDIEGPDESIGKVNNSNYVNVAAMMVLERAISMNARLPAALQDPR
jgi:trehalose/maltose hydrolase-like predicted phosphorylase